MQSGKRRTRISRVPIVEIAEDALCRAQRVMRFDRSTCHPDGRLRALAIVFRCVAPLGRFKCAAFLFGAVFLLGFLRVPSRLELSGAPERTQPEEKPQIKRRTNRNRTMTSEDAEEVTGSGGWHKRHGERFHKKNKETKRETAKDTKSIRSDVGKLFFGRIILKF